MNAYGSDWPEGAVIEMFGERFRITENLGRYGAVVSLEPDDDSFYARFYWQYGSDRAVLISTPNKPDHQVYNWKISMKNSDNAENTIELRPNLFESMSKRNVEENGKHAGFFHSLGRAIQGEEVDNEFLKANKN